MNKPVSFETFLKEQLKDPEFKKEYEALEEEFKLHGYAPSVLKEDEFVRFVAACETASEPNKALRDTVSHAREQGFLDTPNKGAPRS